MSDDLNRQPIYSTSVAGLQAPMLDEPTFQFSTLKCCSGRYLAKTVYADGPDKAYDHTKTFAYKYHEVRSLDKFADALRWLAPRSDRSIIRGQLLPGLSGQQRRLIKPEGDAPATIECPPRSWITLDLDGVQVPHGLGAPDKLVEAGYHIRDMLPPLFRLVRCIVTATAKTGRVGPDIARLRFFFPLPQLVDNEVLLCWAKEFKE